MKNGGIITGILMFWPYLTIVVLMFAHRLLSSLFRFDMSRLEQFIAMLCTMLDFEMENLFNVRQEAEIKAKMTPDEYRHELRHRIARAFEYLRRISFNSRAIMRVAYAARQVLREQESPDPAKLCAVEEIIEAGVEFRLYCMKTMPKVMLWLVFRADRWWLATPSVADLRYGGNADGIKAYYRLIDAMGHFSRFYGEEFYEALMLKLRGGIPDVPTF